MASVLPGPRGAGDRTSGVYGSKPALMGSEAGIENEAALQKPAAVVARVKSLGEPEGAFAKPAGGGRRRWRRSRRAR